METRKKVFDLVKSEFFDEINIEIEIINLNDNFPVFPALPVITVLESELIGSKIGNVTATDSDFGEYGKVTYSTISSVITIDHITGEIFLAKILDREVEETFIVTIVATDGGGLQISGFFRIK